MAGGRTRSAGRKRRPCGTPGPLERRRRCPVNIARRDRVTGEERGRRDDVEVCVRGARAGHRSLRLGVQLINGKLSRRARGLDAPLEQQRRHPSVAEPETRSPRR